MVAKAADTKDSKDTGGAAVAEQEQPVAAPPTPEQTAAAEQAMGLSTGGAPTAAAPAARIQVRMGVAPTTLDEGWRLAKMLAASELVPKNFRNKPEDVLVAVQMGMELGLPPLQSLASIAVINGRASIWGDGFIALIMSSPLYKDHDEYYEVDGQRRDGLTGDDLKKDATTAVCAFWRHGKTTPVTRRFSVGQAKKADLLGKSGPWGTYPDRMLSMRARGFAGRDAFPDLLRGIKTAEEVMDLPAEPETAAIVHEVRRMSQTPADKRVLSDEDSANRRPGAEREEAEATTGRVVHVPKVEEVMLDPQTVKGVEQFLGGFTITLGNGLQVDTTEVNDAAELEKFVGTKHKVRLSVKKVQDRMELTSFAIAD